MFLKKFKTDFKDDLQCFNDFNEKTKLVIINSILVKCVQMLYFKFYIVLELFFFSFYIIILFIKLRNYFFVQLPDE